MALSKLWRRSLRDLASARWRSASIVVSLAVGIGVTAGSRMAGRTLLATRDTILEECRGADLELRFAPDDPAPLRAAAATLPCVEAAEARLIFPASARLAGGARVTAQAIFLDSPQPAVDQLPLICGSPLDPADTTGVLVDRGFAIPHHLAPGDSVDLAIGRARYRTHIRGIVLSSEHLAASVDPQSFIPQKGSLLVVFGNLDLVAGRLGFRMVNDLAVRYAPGSDRRQAEQEVLAACGRAVAIEEAIPRERRFGYRFLEIDVRALSIYAPAIAWTLGGLSLLIAILSFRRMVLAQRREIGTLRALGSSRRQILSWYAGTAALLGLAGIAAAFAPAIAIRDAFARIYGTAIGLPRIDRHFYAGDFLLASIPALLASVAAISAPVLGLLRRSAAATIRAVDSAPARLAPSLLRLLDWTAPMRLTSRWAARNLIRRPGLTAVTTLALAGALGVAVAYRFSSRSMTETAREACRHERWDLSVHFLHPAYPEEMAPLLALPGIRATEPFVSRVVEIEAVAGRGRAEAGGKDKNGGKDKDEEEDETNAGSEPVTVLGIDPCARLRTVTLREGRMPAAFEDGVIAGPDVARRMALRVGDAVRLRIPGCEARTVRVTGIGREIVLDRLIAPIESVRAWTGLAEQASGVLIEADGPNGPGTEEILALPIVAGVVPKEDLERSLFALLDEVFRIVHITTGIAIAMAILFLLTSLNLGALERSGEYATFRSLGCDPGSLAQIVRREAACQAVLAALLSLPAALLVSLFLNGRLERAWFPLTLHASWLDFAPVLAAFVLAGPYLTWPSLRAIVAGNLASAIRQRGCE